MDIASILNELWRRRLWVGVGVAVSGVIALSVVFTLPSLERKSSVTGAASADVLVDTRSSALGSIAIDVHDLTTRAAVYAGMIGTTEVKERIARLADTRVDRIGVMDMGTGAPQATELAEGSPEGRPPEGLSIGATTQEAHPAVKLQALAPTADSAKRLADASAKALVEYVADVQEQRAIPPRERVVLRQLGPPQAIVLVDETGFAVAIAAFIGILLAWSLGVLVVSRTSAAVAELRSPPGQRPAETGNLLIGLWDDRPADGRVDELRRRRDLASLSKRTKP
jgi:hypothetical protein